MSAAKKLDRISVDDYLCGELISPIKHEYRDGIVYAMAGARVVHNVVACNVLGILHARLRGKKCRPFNSDMKIRICLPDQVRFYYPDVSVICSSNPPRDSFQDKPVVLIEVLSDTTRGLDEGEKKDAYLAIPSLCVYALVEQETATVVAYRRTEQGFVREEYKGLDAVLPLEEIGIELPLGEVYEGVEFTAEVDDE